MSWAMLVRGERVEAVLIGEDPATALAFGWKRQPGKQRQGASEAASSYGCAASAALRFRAGIRASVCRCLQPSVSFARQRTSAAASARHRGEKIYWSARRRRFSLACTRLAARRTLPPTDQDDDPDDRGSDSDLDSAVPVERAEHWR